LGVNVQVGDRFVGSPSVSSVSPNSAAEQAGIKTGDVIIEIDGQPINSMAQMQHKLGAKYEGDTVSVTVRRDGKPGKFDNIKRAATPPSSPLPSPGVLPIRDDPEPGQEVRHVFPDSPAAKAGIKAGDRIMKVAVPPGQPQAFTGRDQLSNGLNKLQP